MGMYINITEFLYMKICPFQAFPPRAAYPVYDPVSQINHRGFSRVTFYAVAGGSTLAPTTGESSVMGVPVVRRQRRRAALEHCTRNL